MLYTIRRVKPMLYTSPHLPNVRVHSHVSCNGKSLSGMGLARERWCCTGRWLSRLDMNTCHTSINADILLYCGCSPHLGSIGLTRDHHTLVPTELIKGAEVEANKH